MNITVLGTGNMGAALAVALKRTKHNILLRGSSDNSVTCRNLCNSLNLQGAKNTDILSCDIVFLVVPSKRLLTASKLLNGFTGIIVSVVGFDNYLINENETSMSASETVASLIPTAKVVHGYTWMSSVTVAQPNEVSRPSVVHCSDHREALQQICGLTQEMGFQPIRAGRLINSRFAEAAGFLWGAIAIEEQYGWDTYFEVHPEIRTV